MTKKTKETKTTEAPVTEKEEFHSEGYQRGRPARRKVYERLKESDISPELREYFDSKGYALRFIRWSIHGEPDFRYLHRRQQEDGYEFVGKEELPKDYVQSMRVIDTPVTNGMITNGGDLCLMKVDKEFQKSRTEYFDGLADQEVNSVDVHVLEKKGLRNVGSKSKVMLKEPTFQS